MRYDAITSLRATPGAAQCTGGPTHGKPCHASSECGGGQCNNTATATAYLPFPTHVATRVEEHTGFHGPGNDRAVDYEYGDGVYDPEATEFRGFRWIVEHDTQRGRRTETAYMQAADPFDAAQRASVRPFKAKSLRHRVVDAATNAVLIEGEFQWQQTPLADGRIKVNLTQQIDTTYSTADTTTQQAVRVFAYDAYNNTTSTERRTGETHVSITQTTYRYDAAAYIVDRPLAAGTGVLFACFPSGSSPTTPAAT